MTFSPVEVSQGARQFRQEIILPTIDEFHAEVADEFLRMYGPRRLVSFIERCQYAGPWSETSQKLMGKKDRKYYTVSKLEDELIYLNRLKQIGKISDEQSLRIDQLLITTSQKFTDMNEEELLSTCKEYIFKITSET